MPFKKFYKRNANKSKQSNNVEKKSESKNSDAHKGQKKSSDRKFDGDVSLIQAIFSISRINEEIRDHHLKEYVESEEVATLKIPPPKPIKPNVENIRKDMKTVGPLQVIDDYEDNDDVDEYIQELISLEISLDKPLSLDIPSILRENLGNLEMLRVQGTDELKEELEEAISAIKDRVSKENKKRKKKRI